MQIKHEKETFTPLSREERADRHLSEQHNAGKQHAFQRDEHQSAATLNTSKAHDSAA
jgi:hypothetical protein